jgi:hypothetical protein
MARSRKGTQKPATGKRRGLVFAAFQFDPEAAKDIESAGWARLARNLRAEIDAERIEAYRGTVSLPFEAGAHRRVAVKIVDDRGIESLKVIPLP